MLLHDCCALIAAGPTPPQHVLQWYSVSTFTSAVTPFTSPPYYLLDIHLHAICRAALCQGSVVLFKNQPVHLHFC
jgi:hypothetical protein